MAKIDFSPIIAGASGKIADCVFSRWKGRSYIRTRVDPSNPNSAAQQVVRSSMARCVYLWRSLTTAIKAVQNLYATAYQMSGYNWFTKNNRVDEEGHDAATLTPPNALIDPVNTVADGTGGANTCTITWAGGTQSADHKVSVFYRLVEPASEENEWHLFEEDTTLTSAGTIDITGLASAQLYRCVIINEDTTDDTYSASASVEATSGA